MPFCTFYVVEVGADDHPVLVQGALGVWCDHGLGLGDKWADSVLALHHDGVGVWVDHVLGQGGWEGEGGSPVQVVI